VSTEKGYVKRMEETKDLRFCQKERIAEMLMK
jgi:hypothetical protein